MLTSIFALVQFHWRWSSDLQPCTLMALMATMLSMLPFAAKKKSADVDVVSAAVVGGSLVPSLSYRHTCSRCMTRAANCADSSLTRNSFLRDLHFPAHVDALRRPACRVSLVSCYWRRGMEDCRMCQQQQSRRPNQRTPTLTAAGVTFVDCKCCHVVCLPVSGCISAWICHAHNPAQTNDAVISCRRL